MLFVVFVSCTSARDKPADKKATRETVNLEKRGKKTRGWLEGYVPYKDHKSPANFIDFYNEKKTFFQKDVRKEKLYQ